MPFLIVSSSLTDKQSSEFEGSHGDREKWDDELYGSDIFLDETHYRGVTVQ